MGSKLLKADMLAATALLIFAVVYWMAADGLPKSALGGGVGADGLPKLLAIVLSVLSLMLLVRGLFSRRADNAEAAIPLRAHLASIGVLGIGAIAIILLPIVGYAVTIGLLLIGMGLYYGAKPSWTLLIYGVAGAIFMFVMFEAILKVPMPSGFWPSLFGS